MTTSMVRGQRRSGVVVVVVGEEDEGDTARRYHSRTDRRQLAAG